MGMDIYVSFKHKNGKRMENKNMNLADWLDGDRDYMFDFDRRFFQSQYVKEFRKLKEYNTSSCYATLEIAPEAMISIIDKVNRMYDKQAKYAKKQMKRYNKEWWTVAGRMKRKDDFVYIYENIEYFNKLRSDILEYQPHKIHVGMDW